MNILITGSNGFIGRNLAKFLASPQNSIFCMNRDNCNMLSGSDMKYFFDNSPKFDLIIHTAIKGGRRLHKDNEDIVFQNVVMLHNLLNNKHKFKHMISFGSGAELDRRYDVNPHSKKSYPVDPYGLSKSVINNIIMNEEQLSNFRIYNCFGLDEKEQRMIKHNIIQYIQHKDITIHMDRYMDFFYIEDLYRLINDCIEKNYFPKQIDCCYKQKVKLSEIANIINELDEHKVQIIINNDSRTNIGVSDKDYIGQYSYNIQYIGLEQSLKIIYRKLKNEF